MTDFVSLEARFGAGNYAPLPVTIVRGQGVYLWDEAGRRYIDMMGAYSAVSFGHCHPRLVKALTEQAQRLDTISRAYFSDRLGPFLAKACALTGKSLPRKEISMVVPSQSLAFLPCPNIAMASGHFPPASSSCRSAMHRR